MKNNGYVLLLSEAKKKIHQSQIKVVSAANSQMLLLYWQLGKLILENQKDKGWGSKVVELLSADLKKEFPLIKGLSERNLRYMRKFAETYTFQLI